MHSTLKQLESIQNKINEIINVKQLKTKPKIIVVSKTFPIDNIMPLLKNGHVHYGENKIQEAENKWTPIIKNYPNIKLHMVGKLQSNKAKKDKTMVHMILDLNHSGHANVEALMKIAEAYVQDRRNYKMKNYWLEGISIDDIADPFNKGDNS